ncbi:hypothetical protein BH18VER1_BH18VER1_19190 [soil metagenome]
MTNLVCAECRHENEPERIYCHECGARLDRSALVKKGEPEDDAAETHRRVKAMFDARGAKLKHRFLQVSKLVLGAVAAAAVIQMLRTPDRPQSPEINVLPPQINMDLESAAMSPRGGAPLSYREVDVNAYLGSALKSKQKTLSNWLLQFEGAVADIQEGYCDLTVERSIFGWSLFTTGSYSFALQNGGIAAESRGGKLGKLPVHPALMRYAGPFLFGGLVTALDRDRKSIAKLGGIELRPEMVTFTPKRP